MNAVSSRTPHSDEATQRAEFSQHQEPGLPGISMVRVGPFDTVSAEQVLELLPRLTAWPAARSPRRRSGVRGAGIVLDWLETKSGEGWQARWRNSGADGESKEWVDALVAACPERSPAAVHNEIITGVSGLLLCRVLLPSYDFLIGYKAANLFTYARREFKPEVFARVEAAARERGMAGRHVAEVLTVLSKIVLHTGRDVDEITADDMVAFRAWSISHSYRNRSGLHGAWDVLRDVGVLDTDFTLRAAVRHGQPTIEEMVDRYRIRCRPVRDVLVRYLTERAPGLDFSTLRQLTTTLASTFWADIEHHHPGIETLDLPAGVADAWKQRLAHTTKSS